MNNKPLTPAQEKAIHALKQNNGAKINNFVRASLIKRGLLDQNGQLIQAQAPKQPPRPDLLKSNKKENAKTKRKLRKQAKKQGIKRNVFLQQHGF